MNGSVKKRIEEGDLHVDIVARKIHVTEALEQYIVEKVKQLESFRGHLIHLHVVLDAHPGADKCSLELKVHHTRIAAKASSSDMYVSIDAAIHKLKTLVHKYKDKILDHHKTARLMRDLRVRVFQRPFAEESEYEENASELAVEMKSADIEEKRPLLAMNTQDALMLLDLADEPFVVFKCSENNELYALYKRGDGRYALLHLEP